MSAPIYKDSRWAWIRMDAGSRNVCHRKEAVVEDRRGTYHGDLHLTAALQFVGVQKDREDQRIPMALARR